MQLLIAIAALCSVPIPSRLDENQVLECQKYYIKCVEKQTNLSTAMPKHVSKCILKKKKLGGGE